ncbi:hypothetical protein NHX12_026280 [Muraenolepis orangiensis]|uniref:ALK and LTK ligand 2 n=1 Tax=Muraenolepis orangiensis TaxID=630683 RepID=A0A9Q0IRQ8_9TELE|nr:hypothetical protein NHX12_026280 [Muraenolepis orangiensis]
MGGPRQPCTMGLLMLLCALSGHFGEGAPREEASKAPRNDDSLGQYSAIVKHSRMDSSRDHSDTETAARKEPPTVPRDVHSLRTERADRHTEISTRGNRKKEKFLKHLTGPLYFSPKCRKHVYKLYHNTRDCTTPAYFKRCARLLTRLAGSPQCTEG